jgi:large subunit ribosomal protein L4
MPVKNQKTKAPSVVKASQGKSKSKVVESSAQVKKSVGGTLSVDLYDVTGKVVGSVSLPKDIFGAKENNALLAQAVRVFLANQRLGSASTKTRGEVQGSTRKIYRQKGTGRARHGGIRAPIFVGGGVALGPKPQDHSLTLPRKMKKAALYAALSAKLADGGIKVVSGLDKIEPKSKVAAGIFAKLALPKEKRVLVVTGGNSVNVVRAVRNIQGVSYMPATHMNAYEVMANKTLLFMKDAVDSLSGGDK